MVLVIDNYDSFTYNLVQYLGDLRVEPVVHRNDEITVPQIEGLDPEAIVLSPGPCTPHESGVCLDILQAAMHGTGRLRRTPILGVCLGHQAIGLVAGGTVGRAKTIMHGKTSMVQHDGRGVFAGLENPIRVTRYHSLAVYEEGLPDCLEITSRSLDDDDVMGLRHRDRPIEGVQFHPESILTDHGLRMIANFLGQEHGATGRA
ncbi:MAG: aminodeoxychorismate/anthranilate synthase component II [Fimbriimonadaceae bacterium]|nr:aminodeoxychorismate/anthranilate synthase component II [Fimbriimonadaceae bacterium]